MRRAAFERDRTIREWRKHRAIHVRQAADYGCLLAGWEPGVSPEDSITCPCDNQAGRFRKGQRWLSKGSQRVSLRDYGVRTRQEVRSDDNFGDQLQELGLI